MVAEVGLEVDASSVSGLFGSPYQILVGEDYPDPDAQLDSLGLHVTRFDANGRLYASVSSADRRFVRLAAIPHGVLIVAPGPSTGDGAKILHSVFSANQSPAPKVLPWDTDESRHDQLSSELVRLVLHELTRLTASLAERDEALTALRKEFEWQESSLRFGRQMVQAIGYSTRVLTFEVPPDDTVRASTDLSLDQRIPADIAGLCGISLHVAEPSNDPGLVVISLGVAAAPASLARMEVAYRDLAAGWNDLMLADPIGPAHGDALLTLVFHDQGGSKPIFSRSAHKTSRFGLGHSPGNSLALKIWKGLGQQVFEPRLQPKERLSRRSLRLVDERSSYLFGAAEEGLRTQHEGSRQLTISARGDVGLRVSESKLGGVKLEGAIPPNAVAVIVRYTAQVEAADVAAFAYDSTAFDSVGLRQTVEAAWEGAASELLKGWTRLPAAPTRDNVHHVRLKEPVDGPLDLGLVVKGKPGEIVVRGVEYEVADPLGAAGSFSAFARRVPFAELKSRAEYIFGNAEGVRISQANGFPVFQVSDTEDHMQIHPVIDDVAGIRAAGVLPSGLTRLGAVVRTAHPQGPEARYSLMVVKASTEASDLARYASLLTNATDVRPVSLPRFVLASKSLVVSPDVEEYIALDLKTALNEPADLVCMVASTTGSTAFGWCRWYGIDVSVAAPSAKGHWFSRLGSKIAR